MNVIAAKNYLSLNVIAQGAVAAIVSSCLLISILFIFWP